MTVRTALIALGFSLSISPALADPCEADLPRKGETFAGPVTYIVDGDGLCVGHDRGGIEVRLGDFNAPELHAPGGKEAKAALERIAKGRRIECVADHKSWDRMVSFCTLDGRGLGDRMRAAGIAEGGR